MNILIIPAYEPTKRLIELISAIKTFHQAPIIIVNDGSDASYDAIFDQVQSDQVTIIKHDINQGKGAAIKTGIDYARSTYQDVTAYVTCDSDGQHLPKDIHRVLQSIDEHPGQVIFGARDFTSKGIPFKSKIGNAFSSFFFRLNTRKKCPDTQTGLRAIPYVLTDYALGITDNRFDYEMTFLMGIAKASFPIHYVSIETVYLENNKRSHFRPLVDSALVYKQPIKFTTISVTSAVIDIGLFSLLVFAFEGSIIEIVAYATVIARLTSGGYNFILNRLWSFKSKTPIQKDFTKYVSLYVIQLLLSILFVSLVSYLSSTYTLNKIIVDGVLFVISYYVQKHWVFRQPLDI